MSQSKPEARRRLIAGAAEMLSRRGLNATSIRELAKYSKAPLGSTYHYFPGGKKQVVVEAVRYVGGKVTAVLAESLQAGPLHGLSAFLELWREQVLKSDFEAGCPILSVAVEEPDSDEGMVALDAAARVFATWTDVMSQSLRMEGVEDEQAKQLATLIVSSVEGTVALCRAQRSIEPLDRVSRQLEWLIETAIQSKT